MDASAWISAASGLVGAVIGAGAALFAQWNQRRDQARTAAHRERKEAVEELLVRAQAIDLRCQQAVLLAANVGSLNGLASRLLGNLAPVDLQSVFDGLDQEANALQRAAAKIWLFADDERLVALANTVVLTAMDVVEAHHSPSGGRLSTYARIAITGKFVNSESDLAAARSRLSESRRALIQHSRSWLGLTSLDPYVADPTTGHGVEPTAAGRHDSVG